MLFGLNMPFFLSTELPFDVTTSNVSFLRGSNTQLRDVTAGPLSDVTPPQCTADPTPEPHGRTSSRGPSHSFLVVRSIATIGTFEATRFFYPVVLNYVGIKDKWKLISQSEDTVAAPEMKITGPTPKFK